MICEKCGSLLPEGAIFCGNCGNKIEQTGYQSGSSNGGILQPDAGETVYNPYANTQYVNNNGATGNNGATSGYYSAENRQSAVINGNNFGNQSLSAGNVFTASNTNNKSTKTALIILPIVIAVLIGAVFATLYFTGVIGNKPDSGKTVIAVDTTAEITEATTAPSGEESSTQSISVDFEKYNDSIYISSYEAQLAVTIKIEGGKILRYGLELYNEGKSFLAHTEEKYSQTSDSDSFPAIIDTYDDLDYTLMPSTTYWYRFYVVTKEEKIYSPYQSFTTSRDFEDYDFDDDDDFDIDDDDGPVYGKVFDTGKEGLNVRPSPSKSAERFECLFDGTKVEIIGSQYNEGRDWFHIRFTKKGKTYTGWSAAEFIKIID